MIKIAQLVYEIIQHDDIAMAAMRKGWLNLSSYARSIKPHIEETLVKEVHESSIVTALARVAGESSKQAQERNRHKGIIQSLAVHPNLKGTTYERTHASSATIQETYHKIKIDNKTFLTITQGINEITIIAESRVAAQFHHTLGSARKVYEKDNLVGITVKFALKNLEVPNLISALLERLTYKDINVIEVVSTATELTFFFEKKDLAVALEQLQKDV